MRRTKAVTIEGIDKQFTINELTIKQIIDFMQTEEDGEALSDLSFAGIKSIAEKYLPEFSNVTLEDMGRMAPSEVATLFDAFKEVNSDFLLVAQKMGLLEILTNLRLAIMSDFSNLLVSWSKPDTEESGITDTPSSDMLLTNISE